MDIKPEQNANKDGVGVLDAGCGVLCKFAHNPPWSLDSAWDLDDLPPLKEPLEWRWETVGRTEMWAARTPKWFYLVSPSEEYEDEWYAARGSRNWTLWKADVGTIYPVNFDSPEEAKACAEQWQEDRYDEFDEEWRANYKKPSQRMEECDARTFHEEFAISFHNTLNQMNNWFRCIRCRKLVIGPSDVSFICDACKDLAFPS